MTKEEIINTPNGRVSEEIKDVFHEVEFVLADKSNDYKISSSSWEALTPGLQNYFVRNYPKLKVIL